MELQGRQDEVRELTALLGRARSRGSGALVLRGEPGIGKTALLELLAETAGRRDEEDPRPLRLLRATGIEAEARFAYSGLQMLLRPALGVRDELTAPQLAALESALGLGPAGAHDPMLVGLAALSLLTEYAAEDGAAGVLCLVDDAHWLDGASREALLFAARRLHAEGVVIVFAARDGSGLFPAPGLPELPLTGLSPKASAALLDGQPLSPALRYRLLAEAQGNPLALRELPTALAAEPPPVPGQAGLPLTSRLQQAFHGQVSRLPAGTRDLLLVAAADETADTDVSLRAAAALGAGMDDLAPAEEAGLLRHGAGDTGLRFRHPLIRAAVYQGAPLARRLAVHRALADASRLPRQADRRAWHLAAAATGTDEEAAAALERTADDARARYGHEAAAGAYERAARLSAEESDRHRRTGLAAESALEAGDLERAGTLADRAQLHTADPVAGARLAHVRATARFWRGAYPEAHRLLVEGARPVAVRAPGQAVEMLFQAVHTAWYLGESQLRDTLAQLAAVPVDPGDPATPVVRFLQGLIDPDGETPPPLLDEALAEADRRGGVPEQVLMILCGAALARGQDTAARELAARLAAEHRTAGAAGRLPTTLFFLAEGEVFTGRLQDALATATGAIRLAEDTGQQQWVGQFSSVLAQLAALAGQEEECRRYATAGLTGARSSGEAWARWSLGLLELGAGRAEAALTQFERLTREPLRHHICATRAVPDLVEAAVRLGRPELAGEPLDRFVRWAAGARQPWADALVLRCRALLAGAGWADGSGEADGADPLAPWSAALAAHDPSGRPVEYARTALLYGERLRRARHRAQARGLLRESLQTFEQLGMRSWAARARAELSATGVPGAEPGGATGFGGEELAGAGPGISVQGPGVAASPGFAAPGSARGAGPLESAGLTGQELQVVRLAALGLSNKEIAAQLFLSHRTVGHHLYKAYPKLGVVSRGELKTFAAPAS